MRIAIVIILSIILMAGIAQFCFVYIEQKSLKEHSASIKNHLDSLSSENDKLKAEIEYFSYPENLEKELRQRFNYKRIGEKMMIIVQ